MAYSERLQKFGRTDFLPEGWYWLLRSADLKRGQAKPVTFWNREFVVFRGEDDEVRVLDAHCPHMGAHLCDGTVEGGAIRCPFHRWKFDGSGACIDIPAQSDVKSVPALRSYRSGEAYGLIWLWTGDHDSEEAIPVVPELRGFELDWTHGKPFTKDCHPNVMMINAIDAHHFRSVHELVVDLDLKANPLSPHCIQFSNTTPMPTSHAFLRWASRFYQKALTYEMTYWWGHTGSVMVGPDFLHFYIIFALRPSPGGRAEGQTILVTKKRPAGWLVNPVLLYLTKLVGNYFAKGDTVIFSRIKFDFRTPIRADRPIIDFVEHYENQRASVFGERREERRDAVSLEGPGSGLQFVEQGRSS